PPTARARPRACSPRRTESVTDLWSTALRRLSGKIAQQNFDMWLRPIHYCGLEGQTIRLRAPNPYVRLWFENNYLDVVLDELRAETQQAYQVEFEADAEDLPTPRPLELAVPGPVSFDPPSRPSGPAYNGGGGGLGLSGPEPFPAPA